MILWTNFTQKGYFRSKIEKSEHCHWILNIWISLATKFQLRLMILIFWSNLPKNVFPKKKKQKNYLGTKFQLKLKLFSLDQSCPKRVFPVKNRKIEYHHWILYIGISLGTKFHFISNKEFWILWPNLPKEVILGRKQKRLTSPFNSAYLI